MLCRAPTRRHTASRPLPAKGTTSRNEHPHHRRYRCRRRRCWGRVTKTGDQTSTSSLISGAARPLVAPTTHALARLLVRWPQLRRPAGPCCGSGAVQQATVSRRLVVRRRATGDRQTSVSSTLRNVKVRPACVRSSPVRVGDSKYRLQQQGIQRFS